MMIPSWVKTKTKSLGLWSLGNIDSWVLDAQK